MRVGRRGGRAGAARKKKHGRAADSVPLPRQGVWPMPPPLQTVEDADGHADVLHPGTAWLPMGESGVQRRHRGARPVRTTNPVRLPLLPSPTLFSLTGRARSSCSCRPRRRGSRSRSWLVRVWG